MRDLRSPIRLAAIAILAVTAICSASESSAADASLASRVEGAKPGTVVELGEGVFTGGATLPLGVSLRGAGYEKTIIDASAADVGLTLTGSDGVSVSGLSIRNSRQTGLLVKGGHKIVASALRVTGGITGIVISGTTNGRLENIICDHNRYGIVVGSGADNVVVNCTVADNSSLGLSFPSGRNTVAFNNCIAHSATGTYIGAAALNDGLKADHNLYAATYVGKMESQLGRKTAGEWTTLSGQDAHSVEQAIVFAGPEAGNYSPATALSWALDRSTVSTWGRRTFDGVDGPQMDIQGVKRAADPCVGAFEAHVDAPREADGTLNIKSGAGIAGAGVFEKSGRLISYLFQNLPLPSGEYSFWLPSRDFEGKAIATGDYEVRTLESALNWQYLGMIGNNGLQTPVGATSPVTTSKLIFDNDGNLITGCDGWAENFVNLHGYDAKTGKWKWAFHAAADVRGLAMGTDQMLYVLRLTGKQERLNRIDSGIGKLRAWDALKTGDVYLKTGADPTGLAILDGRLFFIDTKSGNLYSASEADPAVFSVIAKFDAPSALAADTKSHLLWMISKDEKLVAISADGKVVADSTPVIAPLAALAVRDGRLAVASRATGKVHLFDCVDPKNLKPIGEVGAGDGPSGAFRPERFLFKSGENTTPSFPALALGPDGMLAVADRNRVSVFDAGGKCLWHTFAVFGGGCVSNHSDPTRLFDMDGAVSFRIDEIKRSWSVDGIWKQPPQLAKESWFAGDFSMGGKSFGVYFPMKAQHGLLIVRLENYTQIPVVSFDVDPAQNAMVARTDKNHDGKIDLADGPGEIFSTDHEVFYSFNSVSASGDILAMNQFNPRGKGLNVIHCEGLDADGVPIYKPTGLRTIAPPKDQPMVSPYTFKPEPEVGIAGASLSPDGGFVGLMNIRSSPGGTGLLNGAGTDAAGIDAAGRVRWIHPLARHQGLYNLCSAGEIYMAGVGQTAAIMTMDSDGLGLGTISQPAVAQYNGYWLDHPQALLGWTGRDGAAYVTIADNYNGCNRWWRLDSASPMTRSSSPISVSAKTATLLAALPTPDTKSIGQRPATASVRIPRLASPMPIDGDLKKWRTAGITPNVIITPETAVAGNTGPKDASAVIRVAYQGHDLYVQVLRFDDVVSFHQPMERHYLQDCVEMCINGFGPGFKYDITRTTDHGDILLRQRFFFNNLEKLLEPSHAPRVIKVLEDASDVTERELIESVYGEDLSKCKVTISEFKLPIDDTTYAGTVDSKFEVAPGKTFWLGFMIDDNDEPGTDVQRLTVWPATYGTFNPPEDGALATFGE